MEEDRRRFERVQCEFDSSFKSIEESTRSASNAVVQDISEGGIRFRAGKFIPVNHRLLFTIHIPSHKSVEAVARPAWIREIPSLSRYDIGAEFISLAAEDREIIRQYTTELVSRTKG